MGMAFEFPDALEREVSEYLAEREGKGFPLERVKIRCLEDDAEVQANVPVYHGKNLVHTATTQQKAIMVKNAAGTKSSCRDYVKEIAELLARLGIEDPVVSELWQAVQAEENSEKGKSK
jgi:cation transport protein ChaC